MKNEITDSLLYYKDSINSFHPAKGTDNIISSNDVGPRSCLERHEADSGRNSGKSASNSHQIPCSVTGCRNTRSSAYYEHRTRGIMTIITIMNMVAITTKGDGDYNMGYIVILVIVIYYGLSKVE